MSDIYHWYHIYADGDYKQPTKEHIWALKNFGLYGNLNTLFVGIVGSEERMNGAQEFLKSLEIDFTICASEQVGWEQVTQTHMWEFAKDHDGYCSYAHTKGASNPEHVTLSWRRGMEWYNYCNWKYAKRELDTGKRVAGCHWIPLDIPNSPASSEHHHNHSMGFFGGTYWWTTLKEIRSANKPDLINRHCAEHWIGQVRPYLQPGEVANLNPVQGAGGIGGEPPEAINWYPLPD